MDNIKGVKLTTLDQSGNPQTGETDLEGILEQDVKDGQQEINVQIGDQIAKFTADFQKDQVTAIDITFADTVARAFMNSVKIEGTGWDNNSPKLPTKPRGTPVVMFYVGNYVFALFNDYIPYSGNDFFLQTPFSDAKYEKITADNGYLAYQLVKGNSIIIGVGAEERIDANDGKFKFPKDETTAHDGIFINGWAWAKLKQS